MWENNLETFEKLFSIIKSRCSIYSYFLKPITLKYSWTLAPSTYTSENYSALFFIYEPVKLDLRLAVLKIFMIFRVYCF